MAALLCLLAPDALHIDGAGGDEGRDVIRHTQQGLVVFECKRFADRLNDTRKAQIRRSLATAAKHNPIEWNLVLPINPTPGEEKFFERLKKKYTFPLHWRGRTWLNAHMANHPEVRRYFLDDAKQEVLKLVSEMQLAVKELSSAKDAVDRLRTLQERLNELDIHYRFAMATGPAAEQAAPPEAVLSVYEGELRLDVIPRHRSALRVRPITGSYNVRFGPEDSELRDAFVRAMDFGDPVELPAHAVESVMLDAPGGLGGEFKAASLQVGSVRERRARPMQARVRVVDEDDDLLRELPVEFTEQRAGRRGGTMFGSDNTGMLQLELAYDREAGEGQLKFTLEGVSAPPAVLRPTVNLLSALGRGARVELAFDDPVQATISMSSKGHRSLLPGGFTELLQAFDALQQRARTSFPIPEDLTEEEAREVIGYAQELRPEGRSFSWADLNLTLNRVPDSAGLDVLLSDEGGALMIVSDERWEFRGRTYKLGPRRIIWDHAVVEHPDSIRRRLDQTGQSPVRLRPGAQSRGAVARLLDPDDPTLRAAGES